MQMRKVPPTYIYKDCSKKESPDKMQCSVCQRDSQPGFIKHRNCPHYVCTWCVIASLNLNGIHPGHYECGDCQEEVDYTTECPSCYIVYTEQCPRSFHNCLDDEGVYDVWWIVPRFIKEIKYYINYNCFFFCIFAPLPNTIARDN